MFISKHILKNIIVAAIASVFIVEFIKFLYFCTFNDKFNSTLVTIASAAISFVLTAYINK